MDDRDINEGNLHLNECSGLVESPFSTFWPIVESTDIHNDLTFSIEFYMGSIHRSWRWAFKVDSLTVVATSMAGTLEFVFTGFPVGRATEMRTARVDDKEPVRCFGYPNAVLLLPLCIHAQGIVAW